QEVGEDEREEEVPCHPRRDEAVRDGRGVLVQHEAADDAGRAERRLAFEERGQDDHEDQEQAARDDRGPEYRTPERGSSVVRRGHVSTWRFVRRNRSLRGTGPPCMAFDSSSPEARFPPGQSATRS